MSNRKGPEIFKILVIDVIVSFSKFAIHLDIIQVDSTPHDLHSLIDDARSFKMLIYKLRK